MEFTVRPARLSDVDAIAAGNAALALETEQRHLEPAIVRAGVAAALADPAKGRYFVAERGGQVIGQIMHTFEWSDWRNGCFWWVQSVYVARDARGRGVFRQLLDHLRTLARVDARVCGIRLYVERDNERAQRTYLQCGLVDTGYVVMEADFSGAVTPVGD